MRSKPRWREIAYHLAHLPVAALGYALTMAAWCGSLAMLLLPLYVDSLPGDSAKFYFFEITQGAGAARCESASDWPASSSSPRG